MGFLSKFFPSNTERHIVDTVEMNSPRVISLIEQKIESGEYRFNCSSVYGQTKAYNKCDLVSTVIGKVADSFSNLKIWALDDNNKEVKSLLAKEVLGKMNRPNPYENFGVFFQKLEQFRMIYGKSYIRIVKSKYLNDIDYYIIPNNFVTEQYENETDLLFNRKVRYYQINDGAKSYRLLSDEVFVFYDSRINLRNGNYNVLGESRLASLSETISTYVILWEVTTELYGDGGARNLISFGANDPDLYFYSKLDKEKDETDEVLNKYGLTKNKKKTIVVKGSASVHRLTASIKEFGLTETFKNATLSIANKFDYPIYLLGFEASRYKSTEEALGFLYTNTTIPNAQRAIQAWLTMTGNTNLPFRIEPDVSHLDFYQNAKQKQGVAMQQLANACAQLYSIEDSNGNRAISIDEIRTLTDLQ